MVWCGLKQGGVVCLGLKQSVVGIETGWWGGD